MARYDGIADWYDAHTSELDSAQFDELHALLGPGNGYCLDLGCGTGRFAGLIRSTGRIPIGIDVSADQLRLARRQFATLIQGDARSLPFANSTFNAVLGMWISTDIDEFGTALCEIARVLAPKGTFVFHGVHPCFNGPCVEAGDEGTQLIHPTYRNEGRHTSAPWWGAGGIRERVGGMSHLRLATLFNSFIDAGLRIDKVAELDPNPIPNSLSIRAVKTG